MNWRICSVRQIVKIGSGLVRCFWVRLGMITSLLLNTRLIRMGRRRLRGRLRSGREYMQVCAVSDLVILTDRSDLVIGLMLITNNPKLFVCPRNPDRTHPDPFLYNGHSSGISKATLRLRAILLPGGSGLLSVYRPVRPFASASIFR